MKFLQSAILGRKSRPVYSPSHLASPRAHTSGLIGGSGVLATELGHQLAENGHAVHFIAYEKPVRFKRAPINQR